LRSSDFCYCYIEASLNISSIAFLKSLLILIRAGLLYLMLIDLAPYMLRLPFSTIMDKYYYHVGEHFMLISVPIIIFHLISIRKDNLEVFY